MKKNAMLAHNDVKYIACPHCYEKYDDNGNPNMNEGAVWICDNCKKEFEIDVKYSYTYSTRKFDPDNEL